MYWRTACYTLLVASLTFVTRTSTASDTVKLTLSYQTNPSAPYQMGSGTLVAKPPGIAVDIINFAAKRHNVTIRYERYPNARVLQLLDSGMIDGAFMFSYTPERSKSGRYPTTQSGAIDSTRRIARLSYWLYSLPDSKIHWRGNTLEQVNGFIAAEHGDSIIHELELLGHTVQQPKSAFHALLLLKQRHGVVAAALQDIKANPYLQQSKFSGISRSSIPLRSKDYFLIFSHQFAREHPELIELLWKTIGEYRDTITQKNLHLYSSDSEDNSIMHEK